ARKQLHNLGASMLTVGSTYQNNFVVWQETVNMLKVAQLVVAAALQRGESRGSHSRLDYPALDETLTGRHYVFQPLFEGISKEAMPQGARHKNGHFAGNAEPGLYLAQELEEVTFND
ncbi:MAG TPA: FAD-binding protein, partial [Ktedonobacteraceae bacterium]|nr:FAD-binding protein [Ktedonobacteraceae bacterium]